MDKTVVRLPRCFGHAVLLAILLVGTPAAAQTRLGTISGTATDDSRAAMPGVTVVLTSPALQTPEVTKVTDVEGKYQFTELPPGVYRLVFELGGFGRLVREGIQISTGFAARVDVTLQVAQLEETVTVSGQSPLVDLTNTRGGATLSKDVLQTLPISNNYQDVMTQMPGITVSSPLPAGAIAASSGFRSYGVSRGDGYATTMIEGIEIRTAVYPNFATVEEVEARTYGNTAEITRPGPAVQLVVKSGGNDFHGRYEEQFMTDRFQATNIDDKLKAQGLQVSDSLKRFQDFSADLGGRLIRNSLWFYGALRDQRSTRNLLGFTESPGPDGRYGTADDVPGDALITVFDKTLKLSYQVTPKHKLTGFASREGKYEHEFGAGRFVPHESTTDQDYPIFSNKGQWDAVFSDRLVSTVMFATSGSQVYYHDASHSSAPATLDLTTQWATGESFNSLNSSDRYSKRSQINGSLKYFPSRTFLGTHELKIGGNLWMNISKVNTWSHPAGDYQLVYDNGVPTQLKTLNTPIQTKLRRHSKGAYVNDSWQPMRRLTVNAGVRVDRFELWVDPADKPAGQFSAAVSYPRVDAGTWWAAGPRLAMSYDVTGSGRTAIKGTFGGYSDDYTEFFLQSFSPLALTTTTYRWHDLNNDKQYQPGEVNLATNGPDFLSVTGGTTATSAFRLPYSYEATGAVERQIGSSMSARALYVYTKTTRDLQIVNALRPYSAYDVPLSRQDPGPDGVLATADDRGFVTLYDYNPSFRGSQFVSNQYANRDSAHNDHHHSLEFGLTKRSTSRIAGETSFLATKHHRWLTGIPQSPNDNLFNLDETWELSYRASGSVKGPHGVNGSAVFNVISGTPGQRTYLFRSLPQSGTLTLRLEPFGTERGPARSNLNLRGAKSFVLKKGRRLDVSLDLFNALNANAGWVTTYQSGPTFGYVTSLASPRAARFGAAFSF